MFNLTEKQVNSISLNEIKTIHGKIKESLNTETPLRKYFELNGTTYAMIPNLSDCEFGEYIDLDKYITPAATNEVTIEEAARFIKILYRPVKDGDVNSLYTIWEYEGTNNWEVMLDAPADIYVNSVAFFLTLRLQLSEILQSYLKVEAAKKIREVTSEKSFTEVGAGLDQLTTLQREIFSNGMQSLNLKLKQFLPSWHSIKKTVELQKQNG